MVQPQTQLNTTIYHELPNDSQTIQEQQRVDEFHAIPPTQLLTTLPSPSMNQPLDVQEAIVQLQQEKAQQQALLENQQGADSQELLPVQRQTLTPMEDSHEVALIPSPPPAVERVLKRDRKRLNIDQLEQSVLSVLEGTQWTERRGNLNVNLFTALADTLGKPDFVQDTYEDLAPTSLFHKFLDDMARFTCSARITADMNASTGVLWGELDPANGFISDRINIEERIKFLVLKFHQRKLKTDRELAYWSWIFQSGEFVSQNPYGGWLGLCVAMMIHPDFYSY